MSKAEVTATVNEDGFTRSAGRQLALYAVYALLGLAAVVYLLSLLAGGAGSNVSGGAIDAANNRITIVLGEEPPQLDAGRATDASSFIVLAHVMEGLMGYDDDGSGRALGNQGGWCHLLAA
jgi:ABC-type oligopeptide transport system substrate-binding subunit